MNIFETIMINVIFITFPLLFCLLYQSYNQTLNQEKNNLFLDIGLISSFYLVLRFGLKLSVYQPLLLLNIPLIIAYIKHRKISILLLSICMIAYYWHHWSFPFIFMLIEYTLYYIFYQICIHKNVSQNMFVHTFLACKLTIAIILMLQTDITSIMTPMIFIFSFYLITEFTIYLFERAEEILSLRLKLKTFEQEAEIRESLFKITHEIKNPIAVCKGYLDMFDINNVEHSKKYIPILKEEIERVLVLLEDFLSIKKIKIEKDVMDLNMLIESIYHNFIPILEDRNIQSNFEYNDEEFFIYGDYNRLSQVLINLIKNSIEAIPKEKEGMIHVYTEQSKNEFKIIVEDNGKGMNKEELTQIKKPFFTTKQKGTGLGVYLSEEIIKGHEGTITYTSKEGIGTKVTLVFPRKINNYKVLEEYHLEAIPNE